MQEKERKVIEAEIGEESIRTDDATSVKLMGSAPTNSKTQEK